MPAELHIDAHFTPRATLMYPAFAKFSLQLFLMICAKHIDNDMRARGQVLAAGPSSSLAQP